MKRARHLLMFASAALSAGCPIRASLPASRMESPETHGERLALGADLAIQAGNSLEFSDDYNATPITDAPTYARSDLGLKTGGSIGVARRIDLSLRGGLDTTNVLQAKLQLLGEPRRVARQGNFSLAITGGVGYEGARGSGTGLIDSNTDSYALNSYVLDGSIIAGYRILDEVLIYGGPFAQRYGIDVTHELDGTRYDYDGVTYQSGANLGFGYSIEHGRQTKLEILVEVAYAISETGSSREGNAFLGIRAAGVRF